MSWLRLRRLTAHQAISGGTPTPAGSFLLLRDGASYLLLRDGVSKLQLGY